MNISSIGGGMSSMPCCAGQGSAGSSELSIQDAVQSLGSTSDSEKSSASEEMMELFLELMKKMQEATGSGADTQKQNEPPEQLLGELESSGNRLSVLGDV